MGSSVSSSDQLISINDEHLEELKQLFNSSPKHLLARNAATRNPIPSLVINHEVNTDLHHVFSYQLKHEPPVTNQKSSGRCWLFAACNIMRLSIMKRYNLEEFELSQPYLFWYDKLEKCNYFLENILETREEPVNSRLIQHLLADPLNDGGQWDMMVNIVSKYGVVPKSVFPETITTENTSKLNTLLTSKLRDFAMILRSLATKELKSKSQLREHKKEMMAEVYRILCITLGVPPTRFDWCYYDKQKAYHRYPSLTPLEFFKHHVNVDLSQYVSIINDPRNDFFKLYTVRFLGNVVEGKPVRYINLPVEKLKEYTLKTLELNEPVWFGCEVGKCSDSKLGIMDLSLMNYNLFFDIDFKMTKADRLLYGESAMTHAMVFTGVQKDGSSKVSRWRVENSWGTEVGNKGYFSMSDEWFSEYLYQVVIHKELLEGELRDIIDWDEATELEPWDPMGKLA